MIDATTIKPKVKGKSDFFSWQLYRWVKKEPLRCQVWSSTWNSVSGIDANNQQLYIGYMDVITNGEKWFYGRQLRGLCSVGQKLDSFAYGPGYDTKNWRDVTDKFWADYMRIGTCAIHGDLWHDWNTAGKIRTCSRCGVTEKLVTGTITRDIWAAMENKRPGLGQSWALLPSW